MADYTLVAVKIGQREKSAIDVQKILTNFGCSIKIRLGLHDVPSDACSPAGLVILQVIDTEENIKEFLSKLNAVEDVTAKSLVI